MKRVLFLSLQRASNYRKLKLINDSQQVVNHLLREATNGLPVRALLQSCLNLINLDAEFIDEQSDSVILLTQGDGTWLKTVASSYHVSEHLCERVERALRFALADLDWEISSLFTDPLAEMHESGRRYIPIVHHDKLLGVLMVSFLPGYFDVEDEQRFANEVSRCPGNLLHAGRQQQRFERVFQQNKRLIRSMSSAIIGVDSKDCVTQWNTAAENIFQLSICEVEGKPILLLPVNWDWANITLKVVTCLHNKESSEWFEVRFTRGDGETRILSTAVTPLLDSQGEYDGYLLLMEDISDEILLNQQKQQAERLQSIGQLAAGVAHEINTPIQYVGDNLCFLEESFQDLLNFSKLSYSHLQQDDNLKGSELAAKAEELELDYLIDEVPEAIKETQNGVARVSTHCAGD